MALTTKHASEPAVRLGSAEALNMVGYKVDAEPGDVLLPVSAAMQILFNVFDELETPKSRQAAVLGTSPTTLAWYRKGALPQKTNTISGGSAQDRADADGGKQANWITSKNAHFNDLPSIEYMSKNGTEAARQYLENTVYSGGW